MAMLVPAVAHAADPVVPDALEAKDVAANLARDEGRNADALVLSLEVAVEIGEIAGEDHPWTLWARVRVGSTHNRLGQFGEAEAVIRAVVAQYEPLGAEQARRYATALGVLAQSLEGQGRYDETIPVLQQSYDILVAHFGELDPEAADRLRLVGEAKAKAGDLTGALVQHRRVVELASLGDDPLRLAEARASLCFTLNEAGQYEEATQTCSAAIALYEASLGADHALLVPALNGQGFAAQNLGNFATARRLFERALTLADIDPARQAFSIAPALNNLSTLLLMQGDLTSAEAGFERFLGIVEGELGLEHPFTAVGLNNLAHVRFQIPQKRDSALPLYERSLGILRKSHDRAHPDVAMAMSNLARVYVDLERWDQARALFTEALAQQEQVFGVVDHGEAAPILHNFAMLEQQLGHLEAADGLHQRGLRAREITYGPQNIEVAMSLELYASFLADIDRVDEARELSRRELELVTVHTERVLDVLSERERFALMRQRRSSLDGFLALFIEPGDAEEAWDAVLRWKGAAGRALVGQRRALQSSNDPSTNALLERLTAARSEIARVTLDSELAPEDRQATLALVSAEKEAIERDLGGQGDWVRSELKASEVCESLPPGVVLVDFLRYTVGLKTRYTAFILQEGPCTVTRIELGEADEIDSAIAAWRATLSAPGSSARQIDTRGGRVRQLILDPIRPFLDRAQGLIVVPDGAVTGVPFAALPDAGGYLIESLPIAYLDTAASLLNRRPRGRTASALLVGDVDYGPIAADTGACVSRDFAALAGTRDEVASIAKILQKRRASPRVVSGHEATPELIGSAVGDAGVVHLATHGFFAAGTCRSAMASDRGIGANPMVLSGLALAGANLPASQTSDGLWTAEEVATLDLLSADLVVLSACETGLGEIESGEGVLGLRRAFDQAGAQTLVMSLWSVPDEPTRDLMIDFYDRWLHRRRPSAVAALRAAQLSALERYREEGDPRVSAWAAFIATGLP